NDGSGNAGGINIYADSLVAIDQARIATDARTGNAGNIGLLFPDDGRLLLQGGRITTSGFGGKGGGIFIYNPAVFEVSDAGGLASGLEANASGGVASVAGDITIYSGGVSLDGAKSHISSANTGSGDAGAIAIITTWLTSADGAQITTNSV